MEARTRIERVCAALQAAAYLHSANGPDLFSEWSEGRSHPRLEVFRLVLHLSQLSDLEKIQWDEQESNLRPTTYQVAALPN